MEVKLFALCLLMATLFGTKYLNRRRRRALYPPGPTGLPVFGNLFQLCHDLWIPFTAWKDQFGPIFYLDIAGQPVVVLNTHEAAVDLLDRRAVNYSDRPSNIVRTSETPTRDHAVLIWCTDHTRSPLRCCPEVCLFFSLDTVRRALTPCYARLLHDRFLHISRWRRMRRAAHDELNKAESLKFMPLQTAEAVLLTYDLIISPRKWDNHLRRGAASTIMSTVYDVPALTSEDDPAIHQINDCVARMARAALPGAHFVEFFPWMRYLPSWMAKWKRDALDWYKKDSITFEGMYDEVKRRLSEGDERPSFCSSLINGTQKYGLTNRESAWLAAAMFAGGAETTSVVMAWFVTAIAAYPEVQKRAHDELDAVVGRSRMPVFSDFPNLPYIRAIVKEVLRWHPVAPLGLPHRSVADDWYKGYLIPENSIVIANVWALNRDRNVYGEDAEHFNPARFLNEDGSLKPSIPDTKDEGHTSFGFGRRFCVGRYVANNSLLINIASILWAVSITPSNKCRPDTDRSVNMGLVVRPVFFDCDFTPRFSDALSIVEQTKAL